MCFFGRYSDSIIPIVVCNVLALKPRARARQLKQKRIITMPHQNKVRLVLRLLENMSNGKMFIKFLTCTLWAFI